MSTSSLRATLRMARREALRAKGRSALIIAMIALPVLGMSAADVTWRSMQLDTDEKISRTMGRADASVRFAGAMSGYGASVAIRQSPDGKQVRSADPGGPGSGVPPAAVEEGTEPAPDPAPGTVFPDVAEVVTDVNTYGPVSTRFGRTDVGFREFDYAHPMAVGMVFQREGRAPQAADEVAVTTELLHQGGYKVGGTLTELSTGRVLRIVGAVDIPDELRAQTVFTRPGLVAAMTAAAGDDAGEARTTALIRVPGGVPWKRVLDANSLGFMMFSADVFAHPPPASQVPDYREGGQGLASSRTLRLGGIGLGLGLVEMVLLAGPAFAVGARRQRRELGLLGAAGGNRRHIGAVVAGGGLVLGVVGAVVGAGLGLTVAALLRPWFSERSSILMGRYDARVLELFGIAAVGVAVGVVAALIPAFLAAREDIASSLTGRRGLRRGSRLLPVLGLLVVGLGAGAALFGSGRADDRMMLAGVIAAELGLVACCPAIIGATARLGRFLPLSPRLALRDAARSRPRSAPAVAAVMAAVAGSMVIAIVWSSQEQDTRNAYQPTLRDGMLVSVLSAPRMGPDVPSPPAVDVDAAQRTIEEILPGAKGSRVGALRGPCEKDICVGYRPVMPPEHECPLQTARTPEEMGQARTDPRCADRYSAVRGSFFSEAAGDGDTLRRLTGANDPKAAAVLAEGGVVVFDEHYVKDGWVDVETLSIAFNGIGPSKGEETKPVRTRLPAIAVQAEFPLPSGMFASEGAARTLGATLSTVGLVYEPAETPSSRQEQKLRKHLNEIDEYASVYIEKGYQGDDDGRLLMLAVFALVITIGASGVATGLALADAQRDLATLGAVGAPPGVRRRLSAFQSGVIAFIGTALGLAAGTLGGVVIRRGQKAAAWHPPSWFTTPRLEPATVVPWQGMAFALVLLPVLAALLAALLTRSRAVVRGRIA